MRTKTILRFPSGKTDSNEKGHGAIRVVARFFLPPEISYVPETSAQSRVKKM